jgi:hypothetical protein
MGRERILVGRKSSLVGGESSDASATATSALDGESSDEIATAPATANATSNGTTLFQAGVGPYFYYRIPTVANFAENGVLLLFVEARNTNPNSPDPDQGWIDIVMYGVRF